MKPRIRSARAGDLARLAAIDRSCFPPGVAYEAAELAAWMSRPGAATFVAETDDGIAGFAVVELPFGRHPATLVTIDVLEESRGTGIGSALLARSERLLARRGVGRYVLQVDTSNHRAIAFYRRHGFRRVRTLPAYYGNGADAYLMEKTLTPAPEHA